MDRRDIRHSRYSCGCPREQSAIADRDVRVHAINDDSAACATATDHLEAIQIDGDVIGINGDAIGTTGTDRVTDKDIGTGGANRERKPGY